MLKIEVPSQELWNEKTEEFVRFDGATITLEHSLVSISKWESKYHKPFITNNKNDVKNGEELKYYIKCMTITQNVDDRVYDFLTPKNYDDIRKYMDDPMTATTINEKNDKKGKQKPITSEVIYSWMIAQNIPVEFQKWHLNRLLMLIKVCSINNNPDSGKKKMSRRELMARNTALNAARRRQLNSKG